MVVFLVIFVFLSAINTNVTMTENGLNIDFALFKSNKTHSISESEIKSLIQKDRGEMVQIIRQYINERERAQTEAFASLITDLETRNDLRRRTELQVIYKDLENIKLQTRLRLTNAETNMNDLIRYFRSMNRQTHLQNAGGSL